MSMSEEIIKIGQRLIIYRSGYTQSGNNGHVCIGEIESINEAEDYVSIRQWGYDIKEQDFVLNAYVWGAYPIEKVKNIILAQPFLQEMFKGVDLTNGQVGGNGKKR